jgi:hypothetical protein
MPAHATSQALLLSAARLRLILKQQKSKLQSGNNRSREASTLLIETSNGAAMRKTLLAFTAIVCLLTLLVASVSCLHIAAQQQATCSHCPKHSPLSKKTPACCSAPQPTRQHLSLLNFNNPRICPQRLYRSSLISKRNPSPYLSLSFHSLHRSHPA